MKIQQQHDIFQSTYQYYPQTQSSSPNHPMAKKLYDWQKYQPKNAKKQQRWQKIRVDWQKMENPTEYINIDKMIASEYSIDPYY